MVRLTRTFYTAAMLRRAFTVMEILLVLGILSVLTGVTIPVYRDYQIRSDLNLATEQVTQALGRARLLSQSGQDAMPWGFSVPTGTLFRGDTYAGRDPTFDELYSMPLTIGVSGLLEVSFAPLHGRPSATGTIVLTSLRGEQRTVNILIDTQGIAVNADDKLTICHCSAHSPQTMRIPEAAWPGHQGHGDHLGACQLSEEECEDD